MDAQEEHDLWIISNPLQTYKGNPEMIKRFKAENAKKREQDAWRDMSVVEKVMLKHQLSRERAEELIKEFGG